MNILFIVTRGDLVGGAQIHVRDTAAALHQMGHSASVLCGSTGDFTKHLSNRGIPWTHIPSLKRNISPFHDFKAIRAIRKEIRRIQPDLVSTHTAKAGMAGRIAGILEKTPVIFTAHGWQFARGIPFLQSAPVLWIERILSRYTAKIITVSDYDYNLALRKKAAPSEKLITIHNGLPDIPLDKTGGSSKPGSPKLVMVARFQAQKDHKTLLYALKDLVDLEWEIDLVSDGPDLNSIKELTKKLELETRVNFLGQRSDIPDILAGADIFVLASHWEGFPRSIIEAMRASLPVICTDVGGCKESVIHNETGLLVEEMNAEALSRALRELITDREKACEFGKRGRKRYEENFTFSIMLEKTFNVYNEVLGR